REVLPPSYRIEPVAASVDPGYLDEITNLISCRAISEDYGHAFLPLVNGGVIQRDRPGGWWAGRSVGGFGYLGDVLPIQVLAAVLHSQSVKLVHAGTSSRVGFRIPKCSAAYSSL